MERELTLRIVLERPPEGVDFGLQKGRGPQCEIVQKQRSKGGDLTFEFTVEVRAGRGGGAPSLAGPFIQGPPGQRFVYIGIGAYAGQAGSRWSRRLKAPLSGIAIGGIDPSAVQEARFPGTAKDGGPACATVQPLSGWKARRRLDFTI